MSEVSSTLMLDALRAQLSLPLAMEPDPWKHQFARRTYVRAIFAFLEGLGYSLREFAEHYPALPEDARTRAKAAAKRVKAELEDGSRSAIMVISAFSAFSAAHDIAVPDDLVGLEREMQRATAIRDRLTHPRVTADLEVSDEELHYVRDLHHLVVEIHGAILRAATAERKRREAKE